MATTKFNGEERERREKEKEGANDKSSFKTSFKTAPWSFKHQGGS
jgi:hypothetical protein